MKIVIFAIGPLETFMERYDSLMIQHGIGVGVGSTLMEAGVVDNAMWNGP